MITTSLLLVIISAQPNQLYLNWSAIHSKWDDFPLDMYSEFVLTVWLNPEIWQEMISDDLFQALYTMLWLLYYIVPLLIRSHDHKQCDSSRTTNFAVFTNNSSTLYYISRSSKFNLWNLLLKIWKISSLKFSCTGKHQLMNSDCIIRVFYHHR